MAAGLKRDRKGRKVNEIEQYVCTGCPKKSGFFQTFITLLLDIISKRFDPELRTTGCPKKMYFFKRL